VTLGETPASKAETWLKVGLLAALVVPRR